MHTIERGILDAGYQIIAVSPDRPEKLQEMLNGKGLHYTLLSDSDVKGARAFGLAWELGEELLEKYTEFGIDLEDASGESHHVLPVPAVYIVGTDGIVTFQYVNPNHRVRIDPEVILAAVRASVK